MPCYHPKPAFLSPTGKGKVSFTPINGYRQILLPCGGCIGCSLIRSSDWAARCMHEAQMHEFNCFITLTYDNDNLPPGGSLDKTHIPIFIRALRDNVNFKNLKIKYYACGEYGDETLRPHYHICLFGADFPDKIRYSKTGQGHYLFTSKLLDKIWGRGGCKIGALTYETAAYTARYVLKKTGKKFPTGHFEKMDYATGEIIKLQPEFSLMSRRPGIGQTFFERFHNDIYPDDFILQNGRKQKPPRYYDKLLTASNPARIAATKIFREKRQADSADNSTTKRLRVRETVKLSKISTLKRSL